MLYRIALPSTLTHSYPLSSPPSHPHPLPVNPAHSHQFFNKSNPLPLIFWQKGPTPTYFSINTIHSHQFSRKVTHSHPFFKNINPVSPIIWQKRLTTTHFFKKSNPLLSIFQEKQPTPTHVLTKSTDSFPFFNKNDQLLPIFEQKRPILWFFNKTTRSHPSTLLNCSASYSHPVPATFTHSQAFLSFYTAIFYENDLLWRVFLLIQLISGP